MGAENELRILRAHLPFSGGISPCLLFPGDIRTHPPFLGNSSPSEAWNMADYRPRVSHMADYRPAKSCSVIPPEGAPHGESLPVKSRKENRCPRASFMAKSRPRTPLGWRPHACSPSARERHCSYSRGCMVLSVRPLRAQHCPCTRGDGVESLPPRRNGVLPRLYWCLLIRYDAAPRARRREPHGRRCDHLRRHFHRTRYIA